MERQSFFFFLLFEMHDHGVGFFFKILVRCTVLIFFLLNRSLNYPIFL